MRHEIEIERAMDKIKNNSNLTYGYRKDVLTALEWVLGDTESFDGLEEIEEEVKECDIDFFMKAIDYCEKREGVKGDCTIKFISMHPEFYNKFLQKYDSEISYNHRLIFFKKYPLKLSSLCKGWAIVTEQMLEEENES